MTEAFTAERPRLVGLAYRITGSRIDAEDIVQEAWLRAQRSDWAAVDRPAAWFTTVVSRLALDGLRSATHRRETYVGPWLPEPVRTGSVTDPDPAEKAELAESLTFAFLRVLDALSPVERVVFLLADVFAMPFRDIAKVVDRSPDACRQLASRARRRVRSDPVRHDAPDDAARVAQSLIMAIAAGDIDQLVALLAEDVVLLSDGGAAQHAARRPVVGSEKVARFILNLSKRYLVDVEVASLNHEPGVVVRHEGKLFLAMTAQIVDGRVQAVHAIRNPDKLAALEIGTGIS